MADCNICGRLGLTDRELELHLKYFDHTKLNKERKTTSLGVCPDCGGAKIMQEGCEKCQSCGWSKC